MNRTQGISLTRRIEAFILKKGNKPAEKRGFVHKFVYLRTERKL